MTYSQNGWSANDSSLMATYTVPGSSVRVTLRKGNASVVLLEVMRRFHAEVQPLHQEDTGGYAYRAIRGGTSLSNHASGTAVDLRWKAHPLGAVGTFTSGQVAAIKRILASMDGVIRWGGNYTGRKDEMHFEINKSASAVAALAAKIKSRQTIKLVTGRPKYALPAWSLASSAVFHPYTQSTPPTYSTIRNIQNKLYSLGYNLDRDGRYGPGTLVIVRDFQRRHGTTDDGLIGVITYGKLRAA